MWALSVALVGLGLLLHIFNLSRPSVPVFAHWAESTLLGVGFPTVGAIIASRRTHNPIGWLLCAVGLVLGVALFTSEYAIYSLLVAPGSLPAGEAVALGNPLWVLGFNFIVLMLILFPTGQLPSSRWRWIVYLYLAIALAEVVAMMFLPGPLEGLDLIENPLGIEDSPIGRKPVQALVFTGGLIASATLILRLRRGSWVERQQIKWLAYAAAAATGGSILTYTPFEALGARWVTSVGYALLELGVLGIPILHRDSYLTLQALRDRHPHKPYPRLRLADRYARAGLLRGRDGDPGAPPHPNRAREATATGHRSFYPPDRGVVYSLEAENPVVHRQALLPQEV
jgi:hypothetical protein